MIGFYVHHQGVGHLSRSEAIARHVVSAGEPVVGLSSRSSPKGWPGAWLRLARDDDPAGTRTTDPSAGGALHWAPIDHAGLRRRMAALAAWAAAEQPTSVVVDVSVEVAVFLRTMGVPVVLMAQPGQREDPPHQLAYRLADTLVAPWPAWAEVLHGGELWRAKTVHVGAISRFDGRAASPRRGGRHRRVVVLSGAGGTRLRAEQVEAARAATPGWTWTVLGSPGPRWEPDPWPLLCGADVVVTHAGQNAVADVAAARAPAIVIAQDRPHGEQYATAAALDRGRLAGVRSDWPDPDEWPALLDRATAHGGARWSSWSPGDGAQRVSSLLVDGRTARHAGNWSCASPS